MNEQPPQSYKTHRRFDPLWHFAAMPILLTGLVVAITHAVRQGGAMNWWLAVYAFGIFLAAGAARGQTLKVQDRVIRLEMRLRLRELLPAALASRVGELTPRQLVGLRFASDAELPSLVQRCLAGELRKDDDVKREVKQWQADWLRA